VQADKTALMAVTAAIIVGREITISALREWMAAIGERTKVGVAWLGKVKTVAA
jgi:CDP-diacylglycerol--glycerol-3-phosphate 3-phosphatidyltransferase